MEQPHFMSEKPKKLSSSLSYFFTVDHLPKKPNSSQWRLRFKNLKALGVSREGDFAKVRHFSSRKDAVDFGESKVAEVRAIGLSARELNPKTKEAVLFTAAQLNEEGYDPVLAIREGGELLKSLGHTERKQFSELWDDYFNTRCERWSPKETDNQRAFRKYTANTFFTHSLKDFILIENGREIVRRCIAEYMRGKKRNAKNTAKLIRAKISTFLRFISRNSSATLRSNINDIFNYSDDLLPRKLTPEADNIKFTPEQCLHVIRGMAAKGYAAYIVFKLFMGARTLQLHRWTWEIVDWKNRKIFIPKKYTKNRKGAVAFGFEEIKNFEAWIQWAYELEGKPDPKEKIVRHSQPTVNRQLTAIFNSDRSLFKFGQANAKISGSAHARNICRSTFISYGVEALKPGAASRIAEDRSNLHKYYDLGSQETSGSDARAFFDLHPRDLEVIGLDGENKII